MNRFFISFVAIVIECATLRDIVPLPRGVAERIYQYTLERLTARVLRHRRQRREEVTTVLCVQLCVRRYTRLNLLSMVRSSSEARAPLENNAKKHSSLIIHFMRFTSGLRWVLPASPSSSFDYRPRYSTSIRYTISDSYITTSSPGASR